jgi:hypothetical protein
MDPNAYWISFVRFNQGLLSITKKGEIESASRPLVDFGVLNDNLIKGLISCVKCISRSLIKVQMYSLINLLKYNYEASGTMWSMCTINQQIVSYWRIYVKSSKKKLIWTRRSFSRISLWKIWSVVWDKMVVEEGLTRTWPQWTMHWRRASGSLGAEVPDMMDKGKWMFNPRNQASHEECHPWF